MPRSFLFGEFMADTSFVKDAFDILKSMILAVKVIDQYEGGLRLAHGVVRPKRLNDKKIRLREKIITDIYENNMLDLSYKKNQIETILAAEREEMIKKGKLREDKKGVVKKPYEVGRHMWGHTYNPFAKKPDYGEKFRMTGLTGFFGLPSHVDRYSNVLPAGSWWLVPEFWFGIMRVASLPINIQTMEIERMNVPVKDEDPQKGSISIGARLNYIILDVEKAYFGPFQYANYLHTVASIHLSEIAKNRTYEFWNGSSKVTLEFAKEIDKNIASGLIQNLFYQTSDDVWTHRENLVKSATRKSIDDLIDSRLSKELYQSADSQTDGYLMRSNTSILSAQLKTALNFEMKNYGILIPTFGIIGGAPAKQIKLEHSGNVVPSDMNITQAVETREAGREY